MKKTMSTFDRVMENPEWKSGFEKSYEDFLISEFMCEQMENTDFKLRHSRSTHVTLART